MECDCKCCTRMRGVMQKRRELLEEQADQILRDAIAMGLMEAPPPIEDEEEDDDDDKPAVKLSPTSTRKSKYFGPIMKALAEGPKGFTELETILDAKAGCWKGVLNSIAEKVDPSNRLSPWRLKEV